MMILDLFLTYGVIDSASIVQWTFSEPELFSREFVWEAFYNTMDHVTTKERALRTKLAAGAEASGAEAGEHAGSREAVENVLALVFEKFAATLERERDVLVDGKVSRSSASCLTLMSVWEV